MINEINRFLGNGFTLNDWNESVRMNFYPYVRRKSILNNNREILRTELINLARIMPYDEYSNLLRRLLRKYRSLIYRDQNATLKFFFDCFKSTVKADERWMNLFMTIDILPRKAPLVDRVFQRFEILDTILEACYKPHLRIVYGIAAREQTGHYPVDIQSKTLGRLLDFIPETYSRKAQILINDAEHQIPINHWRNIAAHHSFALQTRSSINITYGTNPRVSKRITYACLKRIIDWSILCLATVRLASVITYMEFMSDLKAFGLPDNVLLRLESYLVGLIHNLYIVGFECRTYFNEKSTFILTLRDRLNRNPMDAIIHASQVLDQLSVAIDFDPASRYRYKMAAVRLVDLKGNYLAQASVNVKYGIAFSKKELSISKYIEKIIFDFKEPDVVRRHIKEMANE